MVCGQERKVVFPFSAIVGHEKAKLALLIAAVNPLVGGVLLRGDKGTGKSTMVRALADVLPEIDIVADCPFNCNPWNPLEMCDWCYHRHSQGENLPVKKVKMKVVDLPLSVTVDRLVGTLDVEKAIKEGVKALEPGLLAEANRNILYIDEVNLLDDYIADVLLDAAAMGWNIIEREGVSVKHPARFILVGSMNPEEGELRPQILDRFGLVVDVQAPMDPETRIEIVKRVEEFYADPDAFYRKYEAKQIKLRERVVKARELLSKVEISEDLLKLLAETIVKLGVRTNRAEIVTVRAAKAIAALNGRIRVNLEDLKKAMELSLLHRLRAHPFEKPPLEKLREALNEPEREDKEEHHVHERKRERNQGSSSGIQNLDAVGGLERTFKPSGEDVYLPPEARKRVGESVKKSWRGSRSEWRTVVNYPHGMAISYVVPKSLDEVVDIDLLGTIKAAALRSQRSGRVFKLEKEDIRVRVRRTRVPRLTVLLLDSSGSMAVARRISLAKKIAWELTERMYVKRDSVALIVFKGREASIVVPPTRRYLDVIEVLNAVPTGGRTPLSDALYKLLTMAKTVKMKNPWTQVKAILITDGKANVPLGLANSLKEEIGNLSKTLEKLGVEMEIYDTRPSGVLEFSKSYIDLIAFTCNAKVYKAG